MGEKKLMSLDDLFSFEEVALIETPEIVNINRQPNTIFKSSI